MMRSLPRRALGSLAILLACSLAPGPLMSVALAQSEEDELSKARAKFQQANELEQAGNYAAAVQAFREVGQVRMTPQVRYHIALCEENLGKLVAALGGYELALSEADTLGPEFRTEVEERANALRNRIPKLVIERGEGAEAAAIELDGVSLGASSIGVDVPVDPGPHQISAKAPGHADFRETVTVPESEVKNVLISLEKLQAPPPIEDEPPPAPLEAPRKPNRLIPYAIGAGGVVALGVSGIFFVMQQKKDGDLEDMCGTDHLCRESDGLTAGDLKTAESMNNKLRTYSTIAQISLVTGVVAVGVAGVLLLTEPKSPPTAQQGRWRVLPEAAGADLAGVSLAAQF